MKEIIPSLIASNQKELDKVFSRVKYANKFQVDIMDGKFVKNKSFDFDFILPKGKKYEAHLMVKNPELWITYCGKKFQTIYFHVESTKQPTKIIKQIRDIKKKVGLAISPRTPVAKIKRYLKDIDNILIMTVYPGKYGAEFLPGMTKKIQEIRNINPKIKIEIDGGINDKTIQKVKDADLFISGSYLQKPFSKLKYNKLTRLIK